MEQLTLDMLEAREAAGKAQRDQADVSGGQIGDRLSSIGKDMNMSGLPGLGKALKGIGTLANAGSESADMGDKMAADLLGIGEAANFVKHANTATSQGAEAVSDPSMEGALMKGRDATISLLRSIPVIGDLCGDLADAILPKFIFQLSSISDGIYQANAQFAEFSGAMAAVSAQQTVRDIEIGQTRGNRQAESAGYLAESKSDLSRALIPFQGMWNDLQSGLFGRLDKGAANLLDWAALILEALNLMKPAKDLDGGEWLDKAHDAAKKRADAGKPPRIPG
jgi:hypothetical protein